LGTVCDEFVIVGWFWLCCLVFFIERCLCDLSIVN
jgi:hypothetical protein